MSQDRIDREAAALWRAVFKEPPAVHGPASLMLDLIVKHLPLVGYELPPRPPVGAQRK